MKVTLRRRATIVQQNTAPATKFAIEAGSGTGTTAYNCRLAPVVPLKYSWPLNSTKFVVERDQAKFPRETSCPLLSCHNEFVSDGLIVFDPKTSPSNIVIASSD
jgi:hypothetical protein